MLGVLVSDEYFKNRYVTKFPGGGLQYGEGITDCLKREWLEELGVEISINKHFYTTEFFQKSAFGDSQVISIYYKVNLISPLKVTVKNKPFDFDVLKEGAEAFRYIKKPTENDFTFPIDKHVATMLK